MKRQREGEREKERGLNVHGDNAVYISLSRSLALRVRLKSECGSREFKSKYIRFRILDSTDYVEHRPYMRARAEQSRVEPSRAED